MAHDHLQCPSCAAGYPVPQELYESGRLRVRCPSCDCVFTLKFSGAAPAGTPKEPEAVDPAELERRARRLARHLAEQVLGSRARERDRALEDGSLIRVFSKPLRGALEELRRQLPEGYEPANLFFREALNEVLAKGKPLF